MLEGLAGTRDCQESLVAERDRESATWLPAIDPDRGFGEVARLRSLGAKKGDRHLLPKRLFECFAQKAPVPLFRPRRKGGGGCVVRWRGSDARLSPGWWSPFARLGGLLRGADRSACRCVQSGLRRKMRVFSWGTVDGS
jgi:hypothetical protein